MLERKQQVLLLFEGDVSLSVGAMCLTNIRNRGQIRVKSNE
ncbi:hypothetical protein JI435_408490 [Parastagonospora nodorum SN15]|uniref:Uncharacterized protein n=1 Tax=Phaeosphaeria nodorum (strain SN15 / ATCC MYA-4574 / FGSC 10173) TaxID=321614 RepID=A0A7U2F0H2_PHANO|nr:hypothetical protein JI435_408490 [Parastagonospora nodorum SN15]